MDHENSKPKRLSLGLGGSGLSITNWIRAQIRSSEARERTPLRGAAIPAVHATEETMASLESPSAARRVVVHLRPTGDAPILKQTKFKMPGTDKFIKVIDFLRRQLRQETLFVYVNSAFSPNPDELVIDLYNNFGIDGKLVVNYACSMAWG